MSSQCETVRSTCTLMARCAPRNCRSQLGELHGVVRVHVSLVVVCDEAVVRRTLGLIALDVIVIFVVAIFHRILLYGRYTVHRLRSRKGMAGSSILDRRFGFGPSWICGGVVNVFLWPNSVAAS